MKFKIVTVDRRMNGYSFYKYRVDAENDSVYNRNDNFVTIRNWCWATYGPSTELGFGCRGNAWAWDSEYRARRIYLKGDEELTMFKLKFS